MLIGTVCTRQVVTCSRNATALEIAKLMRSEHVGDVVVVDEGSGEPIPAGVVTDRDLVLEIMALEVDPVVVTAGDIMSRDLVVAYEGEQLDVAMKKMHNAGVRRIPLVDSGGVLVGVVTLDDIVAMHASTLGDAANVGRIQRLEEQRQRP